jgi:hypothetical protein
VFEWLSDAWNSDNKYLRILFWPVRFVGRCLWSICAAFTNVVSGEFILMSGVPNGGTMILVRSVWVATVLYGFALLLHSGSYAEWTWEFWTWPRHLDLGQLKREIADHVPWLGAIFAGVYVALYARFSSQWDYLAGVYNQLKAAQASLHPSTNDLIHEWKAGFAEDAEDLHLAVKPMFRMAVWCWLRDPDVARKYDLYTVGGPKRRRRLERRLKRAIKAKNLPDELPGTARDRTWEWSRRSLWRDAVRCRR